MEGSQDSTEIDAVKDNLKVYLKVSEAATDNSSVVAVSQTMMDILCLSEGDTVLLTGNGRHKTVCTVIADAKCPYNIIMLNSTAVNNLCVKVGGTVIIEACRDIKYGRGVLIMPIEDTDQPEEFDELSVKAYFSDAYRPVHERDVIIVRTQRKEVKFEVVETNPSPFCIVTPNTEVFTDEVEKIVEKKTVNGVTQYLVQWKNSDENDKSWEKADTLYCSGLIADFEQKSGNNDDGSTIPQIKIEPGVQNSIKREYDASKCVPSTSKRCKVDVSPALDGNEVEALQPIGKKILEEQGSCADMCLVVKTGVEIPCHKIFLYAHSFELKRLVELNSEMDGANGSKLIMDEMSEEGAWAFLRFLYYNDLKGPTENLQICFELLCAATKFQLPALEKIMLSLLKKKQNNDFSVVVALQMYKFAKKSAACRFLKENALRIMTRSLEELKELPEYCQLFLEDLQLARELSLDLAMPPTGGSE